MTVGSITARDIEDFYEWMFESGVVANTVIHYHTVLHSAFKRAFEDGLIDSNPFDRIDRPKKNKFTGENYSEEELISMLGLSAGISFIRWSCWRAAWGCDAARRWAHGGHG